MIDNKRVPQNTSHGTEDQRCDAVNQPKRPDMPAVARIDICKEIY